MASTRAWTHGRRRSAAGPRCTSNSRESKPNARASFATRPTPLKRSMKARGSANTSLMPPAAPATRHHA
eukprot:11219413-Lingulodinium_polyedra.AAC.1